MRRPPPDLTLVQQLLDAGLTPTRQRLAVAAVMLTRPCHLSADQVLDRLTADATEHGHISRATVYATLAQFARAGLLRELHTGTGAVVYDSQPTAHAHWVNVDTGEVHDLPPEVSLSVSGIDQLPAGLRVEDVQVMVRVKTAVG